MPGGHLVQREPVGVVVGKLAEAVGSLERLGADRRPAFFVTIDELTTCSALPSLGKDALRSNLPQVDELMQVAKVPVFLLDEHQVVRPEEIGTVDAILDAARRNAADVTRIDLNAQFRCMGSEGYIRWVESLLQLRPEPIGRWDDEKEDFELVVGDGPTALEHRRPELDEMKSTLSQPEAGQTGVIACIAGRPVALDAFDRPETLVTLWPRLLSGSLDAVGHDKHAIEKDAVDAFLGTAATAPATSHEGLGLGMDVVITAASVVGNALTWESGVVHLALFARADDDSQRSRRAGRIESPRNRAVRRIVD